MASRSYLRLSRISEMTAAELKEEWARRYGTPAPDLSLELLRIGVGYKLQEQRNGGLSRGTRSLLRQVSANAAIGKTNAATPSPRKLTPGTRLVRDWHGVGHTVIVLDDGFEYEGARWKSLSAIAKAITGTKWNGPLFFGLTGRKS
ncbi:DUF2924 domain-containing protein [Novosphingobium sp. NDB2Meth1]|uniref:DUF2924 domain-containing protein n=1 Tax=Novosphingobium sp. NDB2Meth1 TaxID=1892847 RepID=UPI0009319D9D|nr:DUF2924 domain-containing protein [Novosphingobium sp. NDB2Meth1]